MFAGQGSSQRGQAWPEDRVVSGTCDQQCMLYIHQCTDSNFVLVVVQCSSTGHMLGCRLSLPSVCSQERSMCTGLAWYVTNKLRDQSLTVCNLVQAAYCFCALVEATRGPVRTRLQRFTPKLMAATLADALGTGNQGKVLHDIIATYS